MRKFYLFMLMAVGLLVSSSMSAMLERPVPPTEPKGPVGLEMLKQNTPMINAPRKAAMVEENVAQIVGGDAYPTLQEAIEEATEGKTVKLLANIVDQSNDATNGFTINKSITLDLNGFTIAEEFSKAVLTLNAENVVVTNGAILTCDWGYYTHENLNSAAGYSYGIVVGGGHATLKDVTVSSYWAENDEGGADYIPYYGVDVRENASLDIENGNYKGYYALKLSQSNNESGQMAYRVGNIHIYGTAEFYTEFFCTINTASDAYVVISGNDTKWTSPSWFLVNAGRLLIEGGTFESTEYSAEDDNTPVYSYGSLWITGGTFIAPDGNERSVYGQAAEYIYGGYFTTTFNRQSSKIPLEGYQYREVEIGGRTLYEAVPSLAKSEQTSETYGSIQEAIDVAAENDKISLITPTTDNGKNIPYWDWEESKVKTRPFGNTISENFTVDGKTIRLDNNGRDFTGKISAKNNAIVYVYGSNSGINTITFDKDETSTIKVVSGIYSSRPSDEYLFEGAQVDTLETNPVTYKVESYVAKIGEGQDEIKYTSLKDAIAAADNMDNATITLLMNADDSETGNDGLSIKNSMTIDLAGNTIYQKVDHSGTRGIFWIKSAGDITIKNGTLVGKDNNTNGIEYESQGGNLFLQNLTINRTKGAAVDIMLSSNYTCALHLDADCHLNGVGSIKTSEYSLGTSTFVINNAAQLGEVNINNYTGSINNTGALTLTGNTTDAKTLTIKNEGTIIINKGTFGNAFTFEDNKVGTITINGGYFTDAVKTSLEGKVVLGTDKQWNKTLVGDVEYWTVMSEDEMQCYIGEDQEHKYTLLDAINKVAKDGTATITLCNDVNAENTQYVIKDNKDITIDLNGYTINGIRNDGKGNEFFSIQYGSSSLTIDDSSNDKNGRIVYELTNSTSSTAYMIYLLNGTFTLNNGILENKSQISMPAVLALDRCSSAEINGGQLIYEGDRGYVCRLRPFNDTKEDSPLTFTLNSGEIKGMWPIWINVENNSKPYVHVSVNGGKILSTIQEEAIYSSSLGANGTFENVKIDITAGEIDGLVALGGGMDESRKVIETVDLAGGIYSLHRALRPQKRSAETKIQYISGGAYYFDYETNASDKHLFSEFCEYIKPGHYATKMQLVKEEVTDKANQPYYLYGGQKYTSYNELPKDITDITSLHYVYGNHEFAFMTKEQEVAAKTYWAVIDAKGPSTTHTITNGTKEEPFVLDPDDYNPIDDIIIDGGVVVVPSDETLEVNRMQVGEGGDGAGVIVRTDATLIVGLNGLQVDEASTTDDKVTYVIVEAGGTLETNGTIISNDVKEIIIESDETYGTGVVYIAPDVTYNNQPRSTISMYTHARHSADGTWHWQHFGIPSIGIDENGESDFNNPTNPKITSNPVVSTYMKQWLNNEWVSMSKWSEMNVPFRGYNLTNDSQDGGVTYTFEGRMIGNGNAPLKFTHLGYNVLANSYTAPIHIKSMFEDMTRDFGSNVQSTVWIYDSENDSHIFTNLYELEAGDAQFEFIAPMQGYVLLLQNGTSASGSISYGKAVWENRDPENKHPLFAPQISNVAKANIVISSGKSNDRVKLYEDADYTAYFENGADASKYMNTKMNIYANTTFGDAACVVSDNLENMYLSITTGDEEVYTLTFENVNNMNYLLCDLITGQYITIAEGSEYQFVAPTNAKMEHRFQIVSAAQAPTQINEMKANKTSGAYTMMGQYLGDVEQLGNLQQGVYIINGVKVVK